MLYAINVLKKDYNEREELYFVLKSKKNVNIETCMFAKYTLNYVLFDEISLLLLPYIPHSSVFDRCHSFTLLCIEQYIFQPIQQLSFQLCRTIAVAQRMFLVKSLCFPP